LKSGQNRLEVDSGALREEFFRAPLGQGTQGRFREIPDRCRIRRRVRAFGLEKFEELALHLAVLLEMVIGGEVIACQVFAGDQGQELLGPVFEIQNIGSAEVGFEDGLVLDFGVGAPIDDDTLVLPEVVKYILLKHVGGQIVDSHFIAQAGLGSGGVFPASGAGEEFRGEVRVEKAREFLEFSLAEQDPVADQSLGGADELIDFRIDRGSGPLIAVAFPIL
jgi:hypothetical protein